MLGLATGLALFGLAALAETGDEERRVVATLNGEPIHLDEIQPAVAFQVYKLQADIHRLLEREIEQAVGQRLLALEAARRGVSVEQLMQAEVDAKVRPVTEAEIDAYLDEQSREDRGQQVRARVATYLEERRRIEQRLAFVGRLRDEAHVELLLDMPPRPRTALDLSGAPVRGDAGAPVTIVVFAGFHSQTAARTVQAVAGLVDEFPGRIRWAHRFYVSSHDDVDLHSALLALAAQDHGRFWELHDALFARAGRYGTDDLLAHARELELLGDEPPSEWLAELERRYLPRLRDTLVDATRIGIRRAPTIFVNGLYLSDTFADERLRSLVVQELERVGPAAGVSAEAQGAGT